MKTIIEAITDENLFRPFFGNTLDTWRPWQIALRVLYGLPVRTEYARNLIRQCTGRDPDKLPKDGFDVALFLTGRRSGKSRTAAVIGAYAAALSGLENRLSAGETGLVPIVSPTKNQGRIVKGYLRAIFNTPMLAEEIVNERKHEGFELKNGNRIETLSGDFRSVRGYTVLTAIVDECAFFGLSEESRVRSDTELIRAIQPSLATCNGRLVAISSPYSRKGWTWQIYNKHFGNDDSNVLVWNCPSRTMNPTLRQSVVDAALKEDYAAARAEYLGEFRDDVGIFLSADLIQNLVVKGRSETIRMPDCKYAAFADLSGGVSDAAALAITHREGRKIILDAVRWFAAPHNPHRVIVEMSDMLRAWGIKFVVGDNYSAQFAAAAFQSNGIAFKKSEKNKSQLYTELLPVLCSGEIELLDNAKLFKQLTSLERRTRSGGKDTIDHPAKEHDDLANAVAGAVMQSAGPRILITAGRF